MPRRFAAALVVLALAASSPAVCAGWLPTPEARMACCSEGGSCPMHESESSDDSTKRVISQAEADRCCGTSERDGSIPSHTNGPFSLVCLAAVTTVVVLTPDLPARAQPWRGTAPLSAARVPKHLLLSVLLV